jgi:ABC-type Na+ efflux pump permease subunit
MSETVNLLLVPLQSNGGAGGLLVLLGIFALITMVSGLVAIAGQWLTFKKANQPGWAAIIPFYNVYIMTKIGDNEWWWTLVIFVPIVQIYAIHKISAGVSNAFGQSTGFALGLWILGFIFWPMLGFGDYSYQGVSEHGVSEHRARQTV